MHFLCILHVAGKGTLNRLKIFLCLTCKTNANLAGFLVASHFCRDVNMRLSSRRVIGRLQRGAVTPLCIALRDSEIPFVLYIRQEADKRIPKRLLSNASLYGLVHMSVYLSYTALLLSYCLSYSRVVPTVKKSQISQSEHPSPAHTFSLSSRRTYHGCVITPPASRSFGTNK
jgi:hypothetical protein